MKKSTFSIISILSVLSLSNCSLAMDDNVRKPIPQKVIRLGGDNPYQPFMIGKPKNFDIIYDSLHTSNASINQIVGDMGFDIEQLLAVKNYCENNGQYKMPRKLAAKIQKKYDKKINLELIENYIENSCLGKGWAQIENELLQASFKPKDIKKFENKYLPMQTELIEKNIQSVSEDKNRKETKQELIARGFKIDHIKICLNKHQDNLEEAEMQLIEKYTKNNIQNKTLVEMEQEMLAREFDAELVSGLWEKDIQIYLAKKYIEENKTDKSEAEIKKDLRDKGFKKNIINEAFGEIREKRLAWLDKIAPPNPRSEQKANHVPVQKSNPATTQKASPTPARKKVNPKVGSARFAKKNNHRKPNTSKLSNPPKNPGYGNSGDKKNNNGLWGKFCDFFNSNIKAVNYSILTAVTSVALFTLYKLIKKR